MLDGQILLLLLLLGVVGENRDDSSAMLSDLGYIYEMVEKGRRRSRDFTGAVE